MRPCLLLSFATLALTAPLAGCGTREPDASEAAPGNFVPPVTRAPSPVAGQDNRTPLSAYIGHYPQDAVGGVSFFDRTEVANALVDAVADETLRHQITGRDTVSVPIFAQGGMIAAHGCEPHDCGDHDWTVLIPRDGDRTRAAVCHHDAATMGDTSRWMTRAGTQTRPGDCPQA
ncbi:hypothetical protein [Sphingomonas abaci]|uniref:Lipoprotein n=1 Tax=Sphingomonas abaci TaxID=237611 RepID=A0A7W7AH05_9SPHN|nr:hypothetical protein [Sphingomonas abaci]MBB4616840.1 hypothetical protein [Sphingomonas abaci]